MAKNNVQSVSYLLCTQVIKPQLSINHKISHDTNLQKTKHTKIGHKIFEELVPSVSPLLKKRIRLGHADIVDPSVDLSIPDFFFKV